KRSERFTAVSHAVARILSEYSTLDDIASRVMRAIGEGLGWPVAVFWALDPAAGVLRCAGSWRAPRTSAAAFTQSCRGLTLRKGQGVPGRVWVGGHPAWVPEITAAEMPARFESAAADGLRSIFAVPLRCRGDVVGVVEFLSRQPRERDPELLQLMDVVAAQIDNLLTRKLLEERFGPR